MKTWIFRSGCNFDKLDPKSEGTGVCRKLFLGFVTDHATNTVLQHGINFRHSMRSDLCYHILPRHVTDLQMVELASDIFVCIVDESKLVDGLGGSKGKQHTLR